MTIKEYYKQILNEVLDNPIKRVAYMIKSGKSLRDIKNPDKRIRRLDKMTTVADRGIIFRKKQLNEIGDTPRGREFLHYYINKRRPELIKKSQELSKLAQASDEMTRKVRQSRGTRSPEEIDRAIKQGTALVKYSKRKDKELQKIHRGLTNALDRLGY